MDCGEEKVSCKTVDAMTRLASPFRFGNPVRKSNDSIFNEPVNSVTYLHISAETTAVTKPPPKDYRFKIRVIGGSGSPHGDPLLRVFAIVDGRRLAIFAWNNLCLNIDSHCLAVRHGYFDRGFLADKRSNRR
jgi:hypothetical protein